MNILINQLKKVYIDLTFNRCDFFKPIIKWNAEKKVGSKIVVIMLVVIYPDLKMAI